MLTCSKCRQPIDTGKLCAECRTTIARNRNQIKTNRINAGVCRDCGRGEPTSGQRCAACQNLARIRLKRWRDEQRAAGRCHSCTNDALPGSSHCLFHKVKRNARRERASRTPATRSA